VAWGDRHCPLLHSYQHLEFYINGKGILQSQLFVFLHSMMVRLEDTMCHFFKETYRKTELKHFEGGSFGSNEIAMLKTKKASELWLRLLQISALRNQ
jgi:hypothetical protein